MKATCLECKHCTSLLQVHWLNTGTILNLWVRSRLSSLSSTGLTSGSPHCSTCLPCTPQPIPPPPTTLLRDQPSPTVRVASTDDVTTHARRAGTNRHLHGVILKQHRRRRRRPSTRKVETWAALHPHRSQARTHVCGERSVEHVPPWAGHWLGLDTPLPPRSPW